MSRLTPIYTIYGRLYTTFGLGERHTGQAGQMACLLGALSEWLICWTGVLATIAAPSPSENERLSNESGLQVVCTMKELGCLNAKCWQPTQGTELPFFIPPNVYESPRYGLANDRVLVQLWRGWIRASADAR